MKENPTTLCQASPMLGYARSSSPSKTHPDYRLSASACSCSRNNPVPTWEKRQSHSAQEAGLAQPSPFIDDLLTHNAMRSGGVPFLNQSRPRLSSSEAPPPPPQ